MPTARTPDGAEIFYETRGAGPVNLAMISGWGGVGGLWFSVARQLDPHQFSCWLIDLRGHGRSPMPPEGSFAWADIVQDVVAVADHQVAETFIPVGFSMGGKLAIYLTACFRPRVSRVALVAPVGPGPAPLDAQARRELIRRAADPVALKAAVRDWFGPGVGESIIDGCCRAIARTPPAILEITADKLLGTPLPAEFDGTDAPALVVMGEHDPHYGPDYQRQSVLPHLPHARAVTLPAGHFAPLEQPAALAGLISSFALDSPPAA